MKLCHSLALLGLADLSEAGRASKRYGKRVRSGQAQGNGDTISGFLSAITAFSYCGEINKDAQIAILEPFLVENNGKKMFYSHRPEGGNKIPEWELAKIKSVDHDEVILTYSNGWCDKNVYKSWNKCAVSGICYEDCEDGNCYKQVREKGAEIPVPQGCMDVYMECAQQCADDKKCKAFSFKNQNILGNGQFECLLMDKVLCSRDEFDHGDPRSVYHVKGSAIQKLYNEYNVNSLDALDRKKFDVEDDHKVNVWSSWSWHQCFPSVAGRKCGKGFKKRTKTDENGDIKYGKKECDFMDAFGNPIECDDEEEQEESTVEVAGHGWMEWGAWAPCTHSCGNKGLKKRTRRCGTCSNPDKNGLCKNPTEALHSFTNDHVNCPMSGQGQSVKCEQAKCLPRSNGKSKQSGKQYLVLRGWQTYQTNEPKNDFTDYEGGCTDYKLESVGKKVKVNAARQAFVECMKECADAGDDCLSVTYFPRLQKPYWQNFWRDGEFNCYLHKRRCHEDAQFRNSDWISENQDSLADIHAAKQGGYQDAAMSWYSFKDLCSNTMICDKQGPKSDPYYAAICDSTGENAFPNPPKCSCPWSRDRHSEVRAWGNPSGWHFYNKDTKRIAMRKNHDVIQRPGWYSQRNRNVNINPETTFKDLPCHDPCLHNKCNKLSKCVFNAESSTGYNCECTWPSTIDPNYDGPANLAGLEGNNGCKPFDFRNSQMTDNAILFGGGWNALKKEGVTRPVKPSPQYYELVATEDPWTFNVNEVMKIPPASTSSKKGRFYNCIVNLDYTKQMYVGGKWGQFFDIMDDKTMVYQWNNTVYDGKWTGLDGQDIGDLPCGGTPDDAGTIHGCTRPGGWPDLPHTPVSACQGQCRNGEPGYGPTNVEWINNYCNVKSDFWNPDTNEWESRFFELCDYKLEQDNQGEKVNGLQGKWKAVPNTNRAQQQADWEAAVMNTLPFFGAEDLQTLDAEDHINKSKWTQMINGKRHLSYWRWKSGKQMDTDKFSVFHGFFNSGQSQHGLSIQNDLRTYNAYGQPLCGVVGDKVMTGSGRFARILSLPKDEENVKKQKVWKIEEGSEFPEPRKRSTGQHCLSNDDFDADGNVIQHRTMDNRRQNFGTVVTTEGMWMIGGLFESAADLPTRKISKRFNIPGCTKTGHLNDVWVFNPKGWTREQILGDAASKYSGKTDAQVLPTISGYEFSASKVEIPDKKQSFADFRLYDEASDGPTIQQAIDEGWECTGIDGKWCRKPFLNRETKGAESQVMCFEFQDGTENRKISSPKDSGFIQKRPRICSNDETANDDNNCICYIIQAAGQSGPKQTTDGAGFRPEIDYLEVRRADGTYGSDREFYQEVVEEYCPEATATYPTVDKPIVHDDESAVSDGTKCTTECGGEDQPACNRKWSKKNLRRRWHEAGRIKNGRMGSLSGVLKGELMLWGGECYGGTTVKNFGPDGNERSVARVDRPRPCRMQMLKNGSRQSGDYIEAFSFIRMNKAGYLFGEPRVVDLVGYHAGQVSHDESAVSQAYSAMNAFHSL